MLVPQQLHDYQKEAVLHSLYHDASMLWLQMGLGKTAIALTSVVDRMRAGQVRKTLVLGPLRVVQSVWSREALKWSHTQHLRFRVIGGNKEKRLRDLFSDADVYLCNYEQLNWLAEALEKFYIKRGLPIPFDMIIYDEITRMKSSTSMRIKGGKKEKTDAKTGRKSIVSKVGWRQVMPLFKYRMGLTGTPVPNGYKDLHGQYLALDDGARLGEYKTRFEEAYFTSNYNGWGITVTDLGREMIETKIADITLKMDAKEYLKGLPDKVDTNIVVALPPRARALYDQMEKEMFIELDSGSDVEVFTRASAALKCLQIANGAIYTPEGATEELHNAKLDALEEIIENANGAPVLVAYAFKSDAERIMKRFKKLKPVNLSGTSSAQTGKVVDDWISGKTTLLIGHPASMGHGIDGLQEKGSIAVWFGPNYSLELYDQFNARLHRQGQKHMVSVLRLVAEDTLDFAVLDALANKAGDEAGIKAAIQAYRARKTGASAPAPVRSFI